MFLVALLRAVNVGGTGKLAMKDLAALCEGCGFTDVRTYIQSGNVVFRTRLSADKAGAALEKKLASHVGATVDVVLRDAAELRDVLRNNPFPDAAPAQVVVLFATSTLPRAEFEGLTGPAGEVVVACDREVYIHFPEGQGRSKLKLPKSLGVATARNMNTVRKLVELCGA